MGEADTNSQVKHLSRRMTVAHIRERKESDYSEVVFLESARFYRLPKETPNYGEILKLLRDAMAKGRSLNVRLASPESDIIEEVQEVAADGTRG